MEPALTSLDSCQDLRGWQGREGEEASHRGMKYFRGWLRRSFSSIYAVTQAEAWTKALPGPVTQFPQFYRRITTEGLLFSLEEALTQVY